MLAKRKAAASAGESAQSPILVAAAEAEPAAADDWTAHVRESADRLLLSRVDSWFTGVNRNVSTRSRSPLIYAGGLPQYRDRCDEVAAARYVGFVIS